LEAVMIRSVAVLGAGTMGAQIAAHLANIGIPTWLLDLTPAVAREGLERVRKLRPDPFFTPDGWKLLSTGGFDEDMARLADSDWIIEAVVERLDIKQSLLARVDAVRRPGSIVSSNTSGLPIASIAEGLSADFRRHWLGTHFFNPPRYLSLVEVIPTPDTDPAVVSVMTTFLDRRLGKGVVIARDTPNFIANHIGLHGIIRVLQVLASGRYTIDEIDAMTGPAIGHPKSATFRTMDIAGIDVLGHVAHNFEERSSQDEAGRAAFALPPLVQDMITRGWIGEKAKQGFYKAVTAPNGEKEILVLDPATMEYRARPPVNLPSLEAAKSIEDTRERIATLFNGKDRVGQFLRDTLGSTLLYAAKVAPDIAYSIDDVDRAMRWGFGWEIGPFETWDALGVSQVLAACAATATAAPATAAAGVGVAGGAKAVPVPPLVRQLLDTGRTRFRTTSLPPAGPGLEILRTAKERDQVVRRNAGASLVDLGDGVLCVEFHSKMNAIGADAVEMLQAGVQEAARNFTALVVGNNAHNFSAGANLMLLLLEAQEQNWEEIDLMVRAFQAATSALRYSDVPVIAAPAGMTLGGGCEVALHGDRVQAAAETYMGLVEVGVGLIPAGGGTKEMLARAVEAVTLTPQTNLLPPVQRVFETIGFAKVSTSALDAKRIGYLRDVDGVTMNRDRLIADAKERALERVREGYQRPIPRTAVPVGGENVRAALDLGVHLALRAGRISEHDVVIGRKLAWILAGGSLPNATLVGEQYILDLEREVFLSLCGEPRTLERIQYTLKTGKTLRN
jgi:3-hydroxyacyl-CoA dehydrogenase